MISTTNDLMARLNNGLDRKLTTILVLNSKKTKSILKFLCEHGFIYNFIILNKKYCKVFLKYNKISLPFCKFKVISKTSWQKYYKFNLIKKLFSKYFLICISTNLGLIDFATANIKKLGGEVLFIIEKR